ncbi:hypothetical protein M3221_20880 [Domibacillus indicus]|uniref:hypothetical protein n=1 Tax=Domibacillus indicus TaxID=1437523 RepID=UPI00203A4F6F|nr:hypothetical protein [Domibacillus indicus]MCM3790804.1 hypothetical protein [Domibacillus indicus]
MDKSSTELIDDLRVLIDRLKKDSGKTERLIEYSQLLLGDFTLVVEDPYAPTLNEERCRFLEYLLSISTRLLNLETLKTTPRQSFRESDLRHAKWNRHNLFKILFNIHSRLSDLQNKDPFNRNDFSDAASRADQIYEKKNYDRMAGVLILLNIHLQLLEREAGHFQPSNDSPPAVKLSRHKTTVARSIQSEVIDNAAKTLSKEEPLGAKGTGYGWKSARGFEYNVNFSSELSNRALLHLQYENKLHNKRRELIRSKCGACGRIPDDFGRCGCS